MAYGVKVQILVDKSSVAKAKFRSDIQKVADAVTAADPIQIKNIQFDLNTINKKALFDNIRNQLNHADLKIKITHINAKPAIENFRKDLVKMLDGLTITGLKEFIGEHSSGATRSGTGDIDEVTEALKRQKEAANQAALAQRELKTVISELEKASTLIGNVRNADANSALFAEYQKLGEEIKKASDLDVDARRKRISEINAEITALKNLAEEEIRAAKAASDAASAAAAEAKKRRDQEEADNKRAADNADALAKRVIDLRLRIQKYSDMNPAVNYTEFISMLEDLENEAEVTVETLNRVNREFSELQETSYTDDKIEADNKRAQDHLRQVESLQREVQECIDGTAQAYSNHATELNGFNRELANGADMTVARLAEIKRLLAGIQAEAGKERSDNTAEVKEENQMRRVIDLRAQLQKWINNNQRAYEAYKTEIDATMDSLQDEGQVTEKVFASAQRQFAKFKESAQNSNLLGNEDPQELENRMRRVIVLRSQLQKYVEKNSRAYKAYHNEFDVLLSKLRVEGNVSADVLSEVQRKFAGLQNAAHAAGLEGQTLFGHLKALWSKFGDSISLIEILRNTWDVIKKMVEAVKDLDTAMTELKKVTDLSANAYKKFFTEAAGVAHEVGTTISDTINAAADFSRLGYGIEEATNLAKVALMYKNVGDGVSDITVATESLISTMTAFNVEAMDSTRIIDAFNEVGNNFAITSTGIGEALQRSASALASAGNTMEQSIGLIAAMNSVIQNPETVGTTIKTISMYLRAAKTEAEDAGVATDGMATSVSALREQLMKLTAGTSKPLDIMLDVNTFKSTYQIIEELSEIWGELTDTTQANIMNLIGGKRNANAISALITNFDTAKAAAESAYDSMGSAALENSAYLDSINGKIEQLKAKFEDLASSVVNSGLVKWLLDAANSVMGTVNSISKLKATLPILTLIAGAIKSIIDVQAKTKSMNMFGSMVDEMIRTGTVSNELLDKFTALTAAERDMARWMLDCKDEFFNLTNEQKASVVEMLDFSDAINQVGSSTNRVGHSFKTFWKSINIGTKFASLTALAIQGVIMWIQRLEELRQAAISAAEDVITSHNETVDTIKSNKDALEDMRGEFERLSEGVDKNGNNVSLTANEYEQYLSLVERVVEISPEVIKGYDDEGKALMSYTELIDEAIQKQNELAEAEEQQYLGQGKTLYKGLTIKYEEAMQKFDSMGRKAQDNIFKMVSDEFEAVNFDDFEEAWNNAVLRMGIPLEKLFNGRLSGEDFLLVYERYDELIAALGSSGLFDASQLRQIKMEFTELADEVAAVKDQTSELDNYLITFAKNEDWYQLIPAGAWDELKDGIEVISSFDGSLRENTDAVAAYGQAFADALMSDVGQNVALMARKLANGEVSIEEYNAAVAALTATFEEGSVVGRFIGDYFYSLSNDAPAAAAAVETVSYAVTGLITAADRLHEGKEIIEKAMSEMSESGSITYDTLKSIAGALGENERLTDYISVENGLLTLNAEAWRKRSEAILNSDQDAIKNQIERAKQEKRLLEYQLEDITSRRRDESDIISANDDYILAEEAEKAANAIEEKTAEIASLNEELKIYSTIVNGLDVDDPMNLEDTISDMQAAANKAKGLMEAIDSLKSGDMLTLDEIIDLSMEHSELLSSGLFDATTTAEQEAALRSVLDTYEEMHTAAIDARISIIDSAIAEAESLGEEYTHLLEVKNALIEIRDAGMEAAYPVSETEKATDAYAKFADSINDSKDAMTLLSDINKNGLSLDYILKIIDLAKENEWDIGKMLYVDGGELAFNESIISDYVDTLLDGLEDIDGMTPELKDHITALISETVKATDANEEFEKSIEGALKVADGFAELGHEAGVSYDTFSELINIDYHYADAIEYVNGKLTLNKEKYDEITKSVLANSAAQAKAAALEIENSEEYIDLMKRRGQLNSDEQEKLDGLNAQIAAYAVLTSEIENASMAYQQFMNADDNVSGEQYTAAQKAFETIQDTLYDKKSELFGKVGRDQYREAIEFMMLPGIDEDSPEWKAAWEKVKRYMKDGTDGVKNFYNDLVSKGFIDKTTGQLNADLYEVSETLGISVDATRALFEELATYVKGGIQWNIDTKSIDDATSSVEETKTPIQELNDGITDAQTNVNALGDAFDELNKSDLSGVTGQIGNVSSSLAALIRQMKTLNGMNVSISGAAKVSGNAYAGGTKKSIGGSTLVGELGLEMVVDPDTNRWYTVGANGAEFVKLPRNAIVFSAKQTKQLFATGRVNERGEAMAAGNLFSTITKGASGGVINGKTLGQLTKNIADAVKNLGGAASKYVSEASKILSDVTKPKENVSTDVSLKDINFGDSPSKSSSGSSSGGSSESKFEKLKEQYEELNSITEHLIEHQEHLYKVSERAMDFDGMEASLTEQAKLYKKIMDDSQNAIKDLLAAGATDADEELQDMEKAYWSAYDSMHEALDQINTMYVEALNDKIDAVQSAYNNLSTAADEFNNYNGLTVDTFQALLENGIQYLSLLDNIDGQYTINKESIQKIIAAEKEQLAVQQALAYMGDVQAALVNGDTNALNAYINASNQVGDSTWAAVYAQAELLKTMGLTEDQYQAVLKNIDAAKALSENVITDLTADLTESNDEITESYDDQAASLDKILDYTKDLIKHEVNQRVDAINKQIDAYKEIIDLKKQSLQTTKDEEDYEKGVAEKVSEIAKLQAKIDKLSLDGSREAQAERAALMEDMAELQSELSEYQNDHAIDVQTETLDNMASAYEAERNAEITALEESISSEEKLYQAAIERIGSRWDTLYKDLIDWNTEAGSSLNSEITDNWNLATEAVAKYGSYLSAIGAIKNLQDAANAATNSTNEAKNMVVATDLPKYHTGGIVGEAGAINDDEVIAVLEKGELVLDDQKKNALYKFVDFGKVLAERLGKAVSLIDLPFAQIGDAFMDAGETRHASVSVPQNVVFSPTIRVEINHSGAMNDADAERFGSTIATSALDKLKDAFTSRGISLEGVSL